MVEDSGTEDGWTEDSGTENSGKEDSGTVGQPHSWTDDIGQRIFDKGQLAVQAK